MGDLNQHPPLYLDGNALRVVTQHHYLRFSWAAGRALSAPAVLPTAP
ncbi:hypothetical protein ACWD00_39685 [Streptomyces viridiviolaceus]